MEIKRRWQRKCGYQYLNNVFWTWVYEARSQNIPIAGRLIQQKGIIVGGNAANGCGESAGEPDDTVADWSLRFHKVCNGHRYTPKDILSVNETVLYCSMYACTGLHIIKIIVKPRVDDHRSFTTTPM